MADCARRPEKSESRDGCISWMFGLQLQKSLTSDFKENAEIPPTFQRAFLNWECTSSNPPRSARHSRGRRCYPSKTRKARCWRPFAIRRRSLSSQNGELAGHFGKSLRRTPRTFPFWGDSDRRLGSIATAARGIQYARLVSDGFSNKIGSDRTAKGL
jgi:hypothetical protein